MKINAYLSFNGQCKEAFEFYEKCLGGKIEMMMTYGDAPLDAQTSPEIKDQIIHVRLDVGDQMLLGSDAPPQFYSETQGMTVSLIVDSAADADRIFGELAENGNVKMPIDETFFALRFGMVVDRFGTPWMVLFPRAM